MKDSFDSPTPCELSGPAVDRTARVVLRVTHAHAVGTLLLDTRRGDGTSAVLKAIGCGWRFSSAIGDDGAWYLPRSRDRNADQSAIDRTAAALRAHGWEIMVSIDNARRDVADIEAERADRSHDRAELFTDLAARRHTAGTARLTRVAVTREAIPLGQPVISDRFAALLRRLRASEAIGYRDLGLAEHWQRAAQATIATQKDRLNPRTTTRRLDRLDAEIRRLERHVEEADATIATAAPDTAACMTSAVRRTLDDLVGLHAQAHYWREHLARLEAAGAWAPWLREHFRPGDHANVRGTWHPIVRANRKTLTLPTWMGRGRNEPGPDGKYRYTDTTPYSNVFGRRRDGRVLHTPPPPAGTGCNILVGGPPGSDTIVECADLELWARLTTKHEAGICSCHPTSPGPEDFEPWDEVWLYCHRHALTLEPDLPKPLPDYQLWERLT
jgi:hypothetical protein